MDGSQALISARLIDAGDCAADGLFAGDDPAGVSAADAAMLSRPPAQTEETRSVCFVFTDNLADAAVGAAQR